MKIKELKNKKIHVSLSKLEINSEDLIYHIKRYSSVDEEYDADVDSIKTYIKERYMDMIVDDIINMLNIKITDLKS